MNGAYLITQKNIYYDKKIGGDRFKVNEQDNVITYKQGDLIEKFEDILYTDFDLKSIKDAFIEIGDLVAEKGNLMIFKNKQGENIYLYNTIDKISGLDNDIIYANILFKDRREQIEKKTHDFFSQLFHDNVSELSSVAKLETISSKEDFLTSIGNTNYVEQKIKIINEKLLEDLFLLSNNATKSHIGYVGKLYIYAFVEKSGQLVPIYFNYDTMSDFDMHETKTFDKIEIIMRFEGKNKVSLFLTKYMSNIMIFREKIILESEIQDFYNELIYGKNSIEVNV